MKKMPRLPKSLRKYVRREKARIRREILDITEQEKRIREFLEEVVKGYYGKAAEKFLTQK